MTIESQNHYEMVIPSDVNRIKDVERITERIATHMNFGEDDKDSLAIAVTEIVGNAISHGNKNDLTKNVTVTFDYDDDTIIVTVQDEGEGFDEDEIENPLEPENLLKESGRGIFIVRALIDELSIVRNEKGTLVRLIKRNSIQK